MFDRVASKDDLQVVSESLTRTRSSLWARLAELRDDQHAQGSAAEERKLRRVCNLIDQAVRALGSQAPSTQGDAIPRLEPAVPGLTGTTQSIPLSSIVSFLADIQSTGVLRIYGEHETYVVQFDEGFLTYAHGDNPPEGMLLGEVLVNQGSIHRADLARVLDQGWEQGETLGGLLVKRGYIRQEALTTALSLQIRDLGNRLFAEVDSRFRFYPGERIIERSDVRLSIMGLLLESARIKDEFVHRSGAA
jgi:hypothetical protein